MIEMEFKKIGKIKVEDGSTILEALGKIDKKIADQAIAAELIGAGDEKIKRGLVDLDFKVIKDSVFDIITAETSEKAYDILNHSSSHIMAEAIKEIFPDAKFAIGPSSTREFRTPRAQPATPATAARSWPLRQMKKIIKA